MNTFRLGEVFRPAKVHSNQEKEGELPFFWGEKEKSRAPGNLEFISCFELLTRLPEERKRK